MLSNWLRQWVNSRYKDPKHGCGRKARPRQSRQFWLEPLEDRTLLAARLLLSGAQTLIPDVNVNVSNEAASHQSEMSVDVNPINPLNVAGFSHDVGSNFNEIDVFFSKNGGVNWTTNTITDVGRDGVPGNNDDGLRVGTRFDPSIAFDANGDLYITYGVDDGINTRLLVARSRDGGATFSRFTTVDNQVDIGTRPGLDKWNLVTGQDASTGNQAVYVVYNQLVTESGHVDKRVVVSGSNDGGVTFDRQEIINDSSRVGTDDNNNFPDSAVGPGGELYVTWFDRDNGLILFDRDLDGLWAAKSTFGTDVNVLQRAVYTTLHRTAAPGQPQRGVFNGPVLDVDRSGGPFNGRLYLSFVDALLPIPDTDIYIARSGDQGKDGSWITSHVDSSLATEFLPWVDVDQTSGSVNVLYYTTDVGGAPPPLPDDVRVRLATSIDGGSTFPSRVLLSANRSNENGGYNDDYLEYIGLAVHGGTAHGLWAQNGGSGTDLEAYTANASFSSATGGNQLVVTLDDGVTNDTIILRRNALNPDFVELLVNGLLEFAGLLATLDTMTVIGQAGDDTLTIDFTNGNPIPAGGLTFNGGMGTDRIIVAGDFNYTLDGTSLTISGTRITLDSVEIASLTGGQGNNTFTVSGWTGTGSVMGGGGTDTVVATKNGDFSLSDALLKTSDNMQLVLAAIGVANLSGGAGNDRFEVSGWTGKGSLRGGGGTGTDTLFATKDTDFIVLSDNSLKAFYNLPLPGGIDLTLEGIADAKLFGGSSDNVFILDGWGGTATVDGAGLFDNDGFLLRQGTLSTAKVFLGVESLAISGGTLDVASNITIQNLSLTSGTLLGAGNVTVTGQMSWTAGTMSGAAATIIDAGAMLSISGPGLKNLNGRALTLNNQSIATWSGPGTIRFNLGSIVNAPGAIFNVQNNVNFDPGCSKGTFSNQGTFRNLGGTTQFLSTDCAVPGGGTVHASVGFANKGTVEVQGGTLVLAGGGSSSGRFSLNGGAALDVGPDTYTLEVGATVTGQGIMEVKQGTLKIGQDVGNRRPGPPSDVSISNLALSGGTLTGSTDLTVTGQLVWTAGSMSGSAATATTIAPGGMLNISGSGGKVISGGRTLKNAGTATWRGPGKIQVRSPSNITNLPDAIFNVQNDVIFDPFCSKVSPKFVNQGKFQVLSGTTDFIGAFGCGAYSSDFAFDNTGSVEVQSGTLQLGGGGTGSGNFDVSAGATLGFARRAYTLNSPAKVCGNGSVEVSALGKLQVNSGSSVTLSPCRDIPLSAPGTVMVTSSGTLDVSGGVTINANVVVDSFGGMNPGGAGFGIVTINGNYTQTSTGRLNIQIGGRTAGTLYDQLIVKGVPTLAGGLNVSLENFCPRKANTFQIMTFDSKKPRKGDFSNPLTNFTKKYTAKNLKLSAKGSCLQSLDIAPAGFPEDSVPPTVETIDVITDPNSNSTGSITIAFSEPVFGFDLADLSLVRDGGSNLLTASQSLTTTDGITWTLGNLSSLTGTPGTYTLTLTAVDSHISDVAGNLLEEDASAGFAIGLPDIVLLGLQANGGDALQVDWEIVQGPVAPFQIGIYRSRDPSPGSDDEPLHMILMSEVGDLTSGVHSKFFTIGDGIGQVALPGAGATETDDDYYILAVADPPNAVSEDDDDPLHEDNTVVLTGVYQTTRGAVFVHGTPGDDVVTIGSPKLDFNGIAYTQLDVTGLRIRSHAGNDSVTLTTTSGPASVWGGPGDDYLLADPAFAAPCEIYGGAGNDRIKGGAGTDILIGGDGDDLIVGNDGRDVEIGGMGSDQLVGNGEDDLLVASWTDFDDNAGALRSILKEWTSARSLVTRVHNLDGTGSGPRDNGSVFLRADSTDGGVVNRGTVHDDAIADLLTGSQGQDWFILNADGDGGGRDRVTDLTSSDFASDIDFIRS